MEGNIPSSLDPLGLAMRVESLKEIRADAQQKLETIQNAQATLFPSDSLELPHSDFPLLESRLVGDPRLNRYLEMQRLNDHFERGAQSEIPITQKEWIG